MPNTKEQIDKTKVSKAVGIAKNHNNWFVKGKISFKNEQNKEIRYGFDKNKLIITGRDTDKNDAFNTLYLFEDGGVSQKYNREEKGHKLTHSNWVNSTLEEVLTEMTKKESHQTTSTESSGYLGYYCNGSWYSLSDSQQGCPNVSCMGHHEQ